MDINLLTFSYIKRILANLFFFLYACCGNHLKSTPKFQLKYRAKSRPEAESRNITVPRSYNTSCGIQASTKMDESFSKQISLHRCLLVVHMINVPGYTIKRNDFIQIPSHRCLMTPEMLQCICSDFKLPIQKDTCVPFIPCHNFQVQMHSLETQLLLQLKNSVSMLGRREHFHHLFSLCWTLTSSLSCE